VKIVPNTSKHKQFIFLFGSLYFYLDGTFYCPELFAMEAPRPRGGPGPIPHLPLRRRTSAAAGRVGTRCGEGGYRGGSQGRGMNLRRGLVRLWVVASTVWVAFWLWRADIPCMLGHTSAGETPWCTDQLQYSMSVGVSDALLVIRVPILIGLLGLTVAWITQGFRAGRSN
jgi:hypothetical protein